MNTSVKTKILCFYTQISFEKKEPSRPIIHFICITTRSLNES